MPIRAKLPYPWNWADATLFCFIGFWRFRIERSIGYEREAVIRILGTWYKHHEFDEYMGSVDQQMVTLAKVSDRLEAAPNCQRLLDVWQQWRGDRLLPTRSDAHPEALGPAMSAITIFEVEAPDRIIFRILSSDIESFTGRTRTGANYVELARPEDREQRIDRHQRMINTPCGATSLITVFPESGLTATLHSLILPLAKDGEAKPTFLYAASDIDSDKRWDILPVHLSAPLANQFDYIDIGRGLPS